MRYLLRRKVDGKYYYNYRGVRARWVDDPDDATLYRHQSYARIAMKSLTLATPGEFNDLYEFVPVQLVVGA